MGWANGGEAGMTAAFAALADHSALTAPDSGSLAWVRKAMAYHGAKSAELGLTLVSYEGGVDLAMPGGSDPAIGDLVHRMQSDPRMGLLYAQLLADFAAAGGRLCGILIDVDAGFYGQLKSVYDKGSPEWDALVAAERAARAAAARSTPIADPTPAPVPAPKPQPDPAPVPVPQPDPVPPVVIDPRKAVLLDLLTGIEACFAKARELIEEAA
jgi:hypothetical protein